MDRLSWYQAGESMEEILCQAGNVGIFDGNSKQSSFEQGTISLTVQRVIWADASDPDCRLILHHSLVDKIERHQKTMFGKGGKIVVFVKPISSNHLQGPIATSENKYLRFFFKNGNEDEFFKRYQDALNQKTWKILSGSYSNALSKNSHFHSVNASGVLRNVGILGIEKRLAEQHQKTHHLINEAFDDMSKLMEQAKEMVILSKNITERLKTKRGEITDDETILFKSYLLSLGVNDPVTKSTFGSGATYFENLAKELILVLCRPLKECGGTMTLTEAYCRINRARGVELISPEDLLNACQKFETIDSPLFLYTFENSDITVIQLKCVSFENLIKEVCQLVELHGSLNSIQLAQILKISLVLATQRLRLAENKAMLCRDDTIEGLVFYPNKFLTI